MELNAFTFCSNSGPFSATHCAVLSMSFLSSGGGTLSVSGGGQLGALGSVLRSASGGGLFGAVGRNGVGGQLAADSDGGRRPRGTLWDGDRRTGVGGGDSDGGRRPRGARGTLWDRDRERRPRGARGTLWGRDRGRRARGADLGAGSWDSARAGRGELRRDPRRGGLGCVTASAHRLRLRRRVRRDCGCGCVCARTAAAAAAACVCSLLPVTGLPIQRKIW